MISCLLVLVFTFYIHRLIIIGIGVIRAISLVAKNLFFFQSRHITKYYAIASLKNRKFSIHKNNIELDFEFTFTSIKDIENGLLISKVR